MHYTQYWRINQSPFATNSQSKLFEGGSVEEAIARIRFMVKNRSSFGLLIGPSLVGKTVLLRHLTSRIATMNSDGPTKVVYLSLLGMDLDAMLAKLTERLSGEETKLQNFAIASREKRWVALEDSIRGNIAQNSRIVLLIDDLQNGSNEIFSILRRISGNLTQLTCVLSVSEDRLHDLPRSLIDRCQLRISLPPWDLGQTADYFEFCMDLCKGRDSIFDAQSITRIQEVSEGLPYRINYMADLCLVAGALRRTDRVTAELVDEVANELSLHSDVSDAELASFDPSDFH